jgi:tetratricopeptide (TPR) repeat protein
MSTDEAAALLELSRRAEWAFPTSFSNTAIVRPGAEVWLEPMSAERPAFAEAATTLMANGDEHGAAELGANVWRLWLMAGDLEGGRAFLSSVLDRGTGRPTRPTRPRALAMYGDALLAIKQGDREGSRERARAALETATEVEDDEGKVLGLLGLSRVAFEDGDFPLARSFAERSRELARGLGPAMSQAPLHMLAQSIRMSGDDELAAELFEESLALNRRIGDEGMVSVELYNLGHVEAHRGNIEAAARYFSEAAERTNLDDPYDAAVTDLTFAVVALGRGERERARELFDRARGALDRLGAHLPQDDSYELERLERQLARMD